MTDDLHTRATKVYENIVERGATVDEWRDKEYEIINTCLAFGDMRTALDLYALIVEVYTLAHRAAGHEPLAVEDGP